MAAKIVQVADELAKELTFLVNLPAKRIYALPKELSDAGPAIAVACKSDVRTPGSRGGNDKEFQIDIGFVASVDSDNVEQIDGLLDQVESIKNLFEEGGALREKILADAYFVKLVDEPLYVYEHLVDKSQFASVLTVTYRIGA